MDFNACNGLIYSIRPGDTLYKISARYNVPVALILRANPTIDIYNMQIGQRLCIPRGGGYDPDDDSSFMTEENMTLADVYRRYGVTPEEFFDVNPPSVVYLKAGQMLRLPDRENGRLPGRGDGRFPGRENGRFPDRDSERFQNRENDRFRDRDHSGFLDGENNIFDDMEYDRLPDRTINEFRNMPNDRFMDNENDRFMDSENDQFMDTENDQFIENEEDQ